MVKQSIATIQGLSKKYILARQGGGYGTLKEVFGRWMGAIAKWASNPSLHARAKWRAEREEFWALQDVSFQIDEGDRFAIIGRNGAGKSTLLKILSRIVSPTYGSVHLRGKVASLLEVGTGFHPELTGRENIYLNGAILGMHRREIQCKFDEIVAFAEVERFLDTPVKRFSSGMYTRLGFAIAAHLDPDILIVDEVLAVGDGQFQEKCLKKMNELGAIGRTIVFVSHDIGAVLTLCNRGIFLEKGRVSCFGSIEDCVNSYLKRWRQRCFSWEGNVGDDIVRIYRVGIELPEQGREFFYQGEKALLVFEYEIFHVHPDLYFCIEIRTQDHSLLGRAQTCDDMEHHVSFGQKGKHQACFEIDTALFHEGEYLVSLYCFLHQHKPVAPDELLLKLPVYALKKHVHVSKLHQQRGGIFLGNFWRKLPLSQP